MPSTVYPVDGIGPQLVLNELLAYTVYYRDNSSRALLLAVLGTFFSQLEITTAKKCLIASFHNTVSSTSFVTERRSSSTRSVHQAELEDILALLDIIDSKDMLSSVSFVAANMGRLPGYAPEETNISAFVDKQTKMASTLDQLSSAVKELQVQSDPVLDLEETPSCAGVPTAGASTNSLCESSMLNSLVNIQQKLDNIETVVSNLRCNNSNSSVSSFSSGHGTTRNVVEAVLTSEQAGSDSYNYDLKMREKNVVMFGVPENNVRSAWCKCVTNVLDFVAGRRVEIDDALRLGAFSADKCRPVLVKLKSVWDRRLVLSNSYLLQNGDEVMRKIFVTADEPVQVRRKNVMARLKRRAEVKGEQVCESEDGCLYVNGQLIYSVKDGKAGTLVCNQ